MARQSSYRDVFGALTLPASLVRFILFVPCGYYWVFAKNHNSVIQNHIELHNGTYPAIIVAGEKIAVQWGIFTFYWNFAVWIASMLVLAPLHLPFAIIDVVITRYMSLATHYQHSYSFQNKRHCNPDQNPNFYDWLRPAGANESFFEAAARLNATVSTPTKMCEDFVEEWQYGVAISFFYALISLLQMLAFFGTICTANNQAIHTKQNWTYIAKSTFYCVGQIPRGAMLLSWALGVILPEYLFRCLPQWIQKPVRYGERQVAKAGLGVVQETEMQVTGVTTSVKHKIRGRRENGKYAGGEGEQTPLAEFLGMYDMLMLVTEHLHYIDINNLSRVSKSVREAVLPEQDFDRRMKVFKLYTCSNTPHKEQCWTCNNQVCADCSTTISFPQTTILHHLDNCTPYCTPCYNASILPLRPPPGITYARYPYCVCAPETNHPNPFIRYVKGARHYARRYAAVHQLQRTGEEDEERLEEGSVQEGWEWE
ncbi:hypothetical protein N0V83_010595 [Neocucurbitaria cava]|uniref:Uncharacterized protein n=1 Tax=Neocucurbitaria cava TaxID=798079 RepID=A0A9W8XYM2_9PLEO|nr:hypothetical protein N0V83_010595 [Neocucurbitaria cava]